MTSCSHSQGLSYEEVIKDSEVERLKRELKEVATATLRPSLLTKSDRIASLTHIFRSSFLSPKPTSHPHPIPSPSP